MKKTRENVIIIISLMHILLFLLIILYKSTCELQFKGLKSTLQFPPDTTLFQDGKLAPNCPGENHKFSLSAPWI